MIEYYGVKSATVMFRKHAAWYSSGMPNSGAFRIAVNQITDESELKKIIKDFWAIY